MSNSRKIDRKDPKWAVILASTKRRASHSAIRRERQGRMPRFAKRVERVLQANDAVPKRRSDLSVIGDLAHLEWRIHLLSAALNRFVKLPKLRARSPIFETRLMELVSEIDTMSGVCADLKPPIT